MSVDKMNKETILNIIFIAFLLLSYITIHEYTHYSIYQIYGCEDIEYGFLHVSAICEDTNVRLAQSINEVVGYCIIPLLILIFYMLREIESSVRR